MKLTQTQTEQQTAFRSFVDTQIVPFADQYDREQWLPEDLVQALGAQGYLGAVLPRSYGGQEMDLITFGLLCEEIGRGCSSVRNLITVQNMVGQTILKWGSQAQREHWLPGIAAGDVLASFALTEPEIGSDARNVKTAAVPEGDEFVINGQKVWTTGGQIADLFLVFAQQDGQPCAFLVERDRPGMIVEPINDMMGTRASMLASVTLAECRVPAENLVGRVGFGFVPLALSALSLGRYTVAWGCVGLAQACLDAVVAYSNNREQFGVLLKEHALIKQMITRMAVNVKAARLLCYQAGLLEEMGHADALMEVMMAKYFASKTAVQAANDAVQIHGAVGVSSRVSTQRYLRDAKIMEIIEGSSQIHELKIADYVARI